MIKAILFDMDGVIVDSEPIQSLAFEIILAEYKKEPVYHANGVIHTVGLKATDNWEIIKKTHNLDEKVAVLVEKRERIYNKLLREKVHLMPGILHLLHELKKYHIKTAIASSSVKIHIDTVLDEFELLGLFDAVISGEDVMFGKPNPEIFLKAAKSLTVNPEHCLVIEDAGSGILAAKAAGMTVVGLQNKYVDPFQLKNADKVVPSLREITITLIRSFSL